MGALGKPSLPTSDAGSKIELGSTSDYVLPEFRASGMGGLSRLQPKRKTPSLQLHLRLQVAEGLPAMNVYKQFASAGCAAKLKKSTHSDQRNQA
eukprot:4415124-Amphidinium_carterae.1